MTTDYTTFLASKHVSAEPSGFTVAPDAIHPKLFHFQRDITRWSAGLGRAALFENVGLGKTFQQLEWARLVANETNKPVLILAPLGVTGQTIIEAKKLDIEVKRAYDQKDVGNSPIVITNYDMVHHFTPADFVGAELKPEYHALGVKHLQEAEALANAPDMFMYMERMELEKVFQS
jgi:hypothetical protein